MADRINRAKLEGLCNYLNKITGHALEPWSRVDGRNVANKGTFYIDGAYGGFSLEQMTGNGGAVRDVLRTGHIKARPLYDMIRSYIQGIEDDGLVKRNPKRKTKKKTRARKSRSRFTHEDIRSPSKFAKGSIRTKTIRGRGGKVKAEIRVGCPKGKYNKRTHRCKVGTRAVSVLRPNPKPKTFRVFVRKGKTFAYLTPEKTFDTDYRKSELFYRETALHKMRGYATRYPANTFGVSDGRA